jgi:nitrogenase molybdenum-iron protein alpha/beta subunit
MTDDNGREEAGLEHSLVMPCLTGVYLAVNAVDDAWLVVDGPNCVFFRTAQIQGNHDWHAELASSDGLHRVADTDCTTQRAAAGDPRLLLMRLQQVDAIEACKMIWLTAMSPPAVTGRQYDKILRELEDRMEKPVIQIRHGSLKGDWLHGYMWTLEDLAGQLALEPDPRDDRVAIVGYLFDRHEADHTANLAELKRLLGAMDLEMASCWLDGSGAGDLGTVAKAGTIVSLPYGREAARILAGRTGARLVECGLPLGLEATGDFLRAVGRATGREKQAEAVIQAELDRVAPKLEWVLPHALLGKCMALMGSDPHLYEALDRALTELGLRVSLKAYVSHEDHLAGVEAAEDEDQDQELLINPEADALSGPLSRLGREDYLHLAWVNSRLLKVLSYSPLKIPMLELGFPSYYTHAFLDCPYLGYRGVLKLVERMVNALSQAGIRQST